MRIKSEPETECINKKHFQIVFLGVFCYSPGSRSVLRDSIRIEVENQTSEKFKMKK